MGLWPQYGLYNRNSIIKRIPGNILIIMSDFLINYSVPVSIWQVFRNQFELFLDHYAFTSSFCKRSCFCFSLLRVGNADQALASNLLWSTSWRFSRVYFHGDRIPLLAHPAALFYSLALIMDMRDRVGKVRSVSEYSKHSILFTLL